MNDLIEQVAQFMHQLGEAQDWEHEREIERAGWREDAKHLIMELNLVQLTADQTLPKCPYGSTEFIENFFETGYRRAQSDMIEAGWRKVDG